MSSASKYYCWPRGPTSEHILNGKGNKESHGSLSTTREPNGPSTPVATIRWERGGTHDVCPSLSCSRSQIDHLCIPKATTHFVVVASSFLPSVESPTATTLDAKGPPSTL
eukprot:c47354_g1_i1 orf=531-860(+)